MNVRRVLAMTSVFDTTGHFCDMDVTVELSTGASLTVRASQFMGMWERAGLPIVYDKVLEYAQRIQPRQTDVRDLFGG